MYEYQFPEKERFRAFEVTEPTFKIQSRRDWFEKLWVDFSDVRGSNHFEHMKWTLGMEGNKLVHLPGGSDEDEKYKKIIYSGHRGCGKSVELKRFADEITGPEAYFTIFIDLESETNIQQLSAEDIYVVMITMLIRALEAHGVLMDKNNLASIANEWMSSEEVKNELVQSFGLDVQAEASMGWSFWKLFSTKGALRTGFSRDNKTTRIIRQIVKNNPRPLIEKFNSALANIRNQVNIQNKGKDLIFFIDGLEKARRDVYETLFIRDLQMLTSLNVHIISIVPIDTYYEIVEQGNQALQYYYLPMIRVTEKSIPVLKDMVYRRVDHSLIEDGALDKLVEMSGGCPRILLKMVNRGLLLTEVDKITMEVADKVIKREGNERYRTLTTEHKEIIEKRTFDGADPLVLQLLHSLNVLEYNGDDTERKLNPVLERFF